MACRCNFYLTHQHLQIFYVRSRRSPIFFCFCFPPFIFFRFSYLFSPPLLVPSSSIFFLHTITLFLFLFLIYLVISFPTCFLLFSLIYLFFLLMQMFLLFYNLCCSIYFFNNWMHINSRSLPIS